MPKLSEIPLGADADFRDTDTVVLTQPTAPGATTYRQRRYAASKLRGQTGAQGIQGPAGRGVQSVTQSNGRFLVTYTDGTTSDGGPVPTAGTTTGTTGGSTTGTGTTGTSTTQPATPSGALSGVPTSGVAGAAVSGVGYTLSGASSGTVQWYAGANAVGSAVGVSGASGTVSGLAFPGAAGTYTLQFRAGGTVLWTSGAVTVAAASTGTTTGTGSTATTTGSTTAGSAVAHPGLAFPTGPRPNVRQSLISPAFFVSPTGSDSNAGTAAAPFATLAKAQAAMRAGTTKTAYLRGGLYPLTARLELDSRDNNTAWLGYPGEVPILDGGGDGITGGLRSPILLSYNSAGITVDHLTIRNCAYAGVEMHGGTGIPSTNHKITNNTIYNVTFPSNVYGAGQAGGIFGVFAATNNLVEYNLVYDTQCPSITFTAGTADESINGNIVRRNRCLRSNNSGQTDSGGIYLIDRGRSIRSFVIDGNYVEDCDKFDFGGGPGANCRNTKGIYLDDQASNVLITNNIVTGKGSMAFQLHGSDNCNIVNNIFDVSHYMLMCLYQDNAEFGNTGMANNKFQNNIVYGTTRYTGNVGEAGQPGLWTTLVAQTGSAKPIVSGNLYFNTVEPFPNSGSVDVIDTTAVVADPKFANVAGKDYSFSDGGTAAAAIRFDPINQAWIGPSTTVYAADGQTSGSNTTGTGTTNTAGTTTSNTGTTGTSTTGSTSTTTSGGSTGTTTTTPASPTTTTAGVISPAFYVSPTGSDANAGTAAAPFATLEKARDAMRASGTKATYLRAGLYGRTARLALGGAPGRDAGTSWLGYPGETAIVDGGSTVEDLFWLDYHSRDITIAGLTMRNAVACMVHLNGYQTAGDDGTISGVVVQDCTMTNVLTKNQYGAGNTGAIRATFVTRNNTFRNNLITDTYGPAISLVAGGANEWSIGNKVLFNKCLRTNNTGQEDTGGLYFLDRGHTAEQANPTIVQGNYVEGVGGGLGTKHIYLDDNASCFNILDNIFCGKAQYGLQLHGSDHVALSNNIWDLSETPNAVDQFLALYQDVTGVNFTNYGMAQNTFNKNIVYTSGSYYQNQLWQFLDQSGGKIAKPSSVSNNLYFSPVATLPAGSGTIPDTAPRSADPRFRNAAGRDYGFLDASGYGLIGFAPIDQAAIGPRR